MKEIRKEREDERKKKQVKRVKKSKRLKRAITNQIKSGSRKGNLNLKKGLAQEDEYIHRLKEMERVRE